MEFSRYLNEALRRRRQRERLEQLERELTEEFGPIPEEVRARGGVRNGPS